jgi:hypothetical protein
MIIAKNKVNLNDLYNGLFITKVEVKMIVVISEFEK